MIQKSKSFAIVAICCLICTGLLFQSCEKDHLFSYEDNEYLEIQNLNKKNYSQEEKAILLKAEQRISENVRIEGGKMTLNHTNADELNMDEDLFNIFNYVVINSKKAPKSSSYNIIRLKSGSTEGGDDESDRGLIGDLIYNNCGSETEQECFDNYWSGNGDMDMSDDTWSGVSSYAESTIGSNYQNGEQVTIDGSTYYKNSVSFYGNSDYDCAYGTATVYFDSNGNAAGFSDDYDFNSMDWGERSVVAEIGTRTIGALGEAHGAEDYSIYYGIHE